MGYLYVIQAGSEDYYKIGVSDSDPTLTRLKQLQTGNHLPLSVRCVWSTTIHNHVEKVLHAALSAHKTSGEWFNIPFDVIENKIGVLKQLLDGNDNALVDTADVLLDESLDFESKVLLLSEQGLSVSQILIKLGYTNGNNYAKYKTVVEQLIKPAV